MKIGILTFHSQLNYGGVLQCWALKTALEGMGHEVVVVDRWHYPDNRMLRQEFAALTAKGWVKLLVRGLLGCGDFGKLLRTIRTIRFVRGLGLTKEHFCEWSEISPSRKLQKPFQSARPRHIPRRRFPKGSLDGVPRPSNMSVSHLDLLVVGSDQVWHCGDWGDPRPYLLEGAPEIRAIAYAASFGLKSILADMIALYKRGLGRFSAISCREQEGVEICRGLGYGATHVVDPTLLLEPKEWNRLLNGGETPPPRALDKKLVCYFMSVDVVAALPLLEKFATRMDCSVEVLTNDAYLKPMPSSTRWLRGRDVPAPWRRTSRVKICRGYGPKEFVKAFAGATWTLTDSFHAVMFSSIFNCNARFLRPANEMRKAMFARIEEFAGKCVKGDFFVDDVVQALLSFERGETIAYDAAQIAAMRAKSVKWLENAIMSV